MASMAKLMVELGLDDQLTGKLGGISSKLTKVLGVAAIAGAAAGVGVALFKIGSAADDMADTIAVKTGASGKAFEDLQKTSMDVFKSIPTDMHTAAVAVSELSVKTGATGKNLDALAKSEIELARITGTDLNANIDASSKLFNVFGVAAKDQVKTLDAFFNVSQKTGVGVDQLMTETQQFAPVLKALGLNAGSSANLIGKLDQAGLHTTVVMQGFKKSIGVFAKQGVSDIHAGLTTVFGDIKNAGTAADGTAIAMKYFGAKAGPELAQAIRDGTLSVDDLNAILGETGDSILDTASKTNDFAENFKIFKNNVEAALIPLGTFVFQGLNLLIPLMTAGVQAIGDFVTNLKPFGNAMKAAFDSGVPIRDLVEFLPPGLQNLEHGFLMVADAAGDLVHAFQSGGFTGLVRALPGEIEQALSGLGSIAINATVDIASWTLGKVADLWGWLQGLFGAGTPTGDGTGGPDTDKVVTLSDVAVSIGGWIINSAVDIGLDIVRFLASTAVTLARVSVSIGGWLIATAKDIGPDIVAFLRTTAVQLASVAVSIGGWLLTAVQDITPPIQAWINAHKSAVVVPVDATIHFASVSLPDLGEQILTGIVNLDTKGWGEALGAKLRSLNWVAAAQEFWNGLKAALDSNVGVVLLFFTSLPLLLVTAVAGASALMALKAGEFIAGFLSGLTGGWTDLVVPWLTTVPGMVQDLFSDAIGWLVLAGINVLAGFNSGLQGAWTGTIVPAIQGIGPWIISQFANALGWLVSAGINVMSGLKSGLEGVSIVGTIQSVISDIISPFGGAFNWLFGAGYDAISGLIAGAESRIPGLEFVINNVIGLWGKIKALGNSPWPMMIEAGQDAMDGLIVGTKNRMPVLTNALDGVVNAYALGLNPSMSTAFATQGAGGMGASTTNSYGGISIYVNGNGDPKATADEVFSVFARELNLRTAS